MDPYIAELLEPAIVFATMLGVAFAVKRLIWGKGPIRRIRRPAEHPALEQRFAELEERWEQSSDQIALLAPKQAPALELDVAGAETRRRVAG